jgi:hypothetical protein
MKSVPGAVAAGQSIADFQLELTQEEIGNPAIDDWQCQDPVAIAQYRLHALGASSLTKSSLQIRVFLV